MTILLVCAATFRLTRFAVDDDFPAMRWFRDRVSVRAHPPSLTEGRRWSTYLYDILSCYWCASIWIAAGVTALADTLTREGLPAPALVALAASGITGIVATVLPD